MRIGLLRSEKTKFGPRLLRMETTMTTMTMTKPKTMTMMTMVTMVTTMTTIRMTMMMTEAWPEDDVLQQGRGPTTMMIQTIMDDDDRGVARR